MELTVWDELSALCDSWTLHPGFVLNVQGRHVGAGAGRASFNGDTAELAARCAVESIRTAKEIEDFRWAHSDTRRLLKFFAEHPTVTSTFGDSYSLMEELESLRLFIEGALEPHGLVVSAHEGNPGDLIDAENA